MGDVVELFPQQDGESTPEADVVMLDTPTTMCEGILHVFAAVPGPCMCGEETWGPYGLDDPTDNAIGIHHVA